MLAAGGAGADTCRLLRYSFQPDCYRPAGSEATAETCVQSESIDHLDFGPQIAVWLENTDRTRFYTLMVTNMTAARGIGNRPGIWNFLSGPKFPYGRREMVLPIWAHAQGKLYPQVIMQEPDREDWLGWHEIYSSPDPFFCRPLQASEFSVDAISCPTKFNSEKGKIAAGTSSYYPPRNDLTTFVQSNGPGCEAPPPAPPAVDPCEPRRYSVINDLDAVATATPPYGQPYSGTWYIPADLPAGDYTVRVEVNKEYDNNAAHQHPSFVDPNLVGYGQPNNFGQPSVVYEVPIHIDTAGPSAAVSHISGYSDWTGADGSLIPADSTISTTEPGSGEGRLLEISRGTDTGRVIVDVEPCVCMPLPPPPTAVGGLVVVDTSITATSVEIRFQHAESNGGPVLGYDIRYREGTSMTEAEFEQSALHATAISPGTPGAPASVIIQDLKPATSYVLGIRSYDACDSKSPLAEVAFSTVVMKFKQVSGCFIATAAYGSAMEPAVAALRQARDRLRPASSILAAATDLYYRSGPAAADVIRRSATARAVVRRLLGPVAVIAESLGR